MNRAWKRLRERDAARELGARVRGDQQKAAAAEWHKLVWPVAGSQQRKDPPAWVKSENDRDRWEQSFDERDQLSCANSPTKRGRRCRPTSQKKTPNPRRGNQ